MTSTPQPYNSTIQAAVAKIEFEIRSVLEKSPDGLKNSDVAFLLGLGRDDPKQWMSFTILQRLVSKGAARKDPVTKRYFSVSRASAAPTAVRPFGQPV